MTEPDRSLRQLPSEQHHVVAEVYESVSRHHAEMRAGKHRCDCRWVRWQDVDDALDRALAERDRRIAVLVAALEDAKAHCDELRDAWERGALSELDGKGGTRSNRNVDVIVSIRAALDTAKGAT